MPVKVDCVIVFENKLLINKIWRRIKIYLEDFTN